MMRFHFSKKNIQAKSGFTLVEMLVSVAIFSVFMLVAVSVVLSIIGGNRKAQAINAVVNNLNFAIESMVRDMKTGYFYRCEGNYDFSEMEDPSSNFYQIPASDDILCAAAVSAPQTVVAFVSVLSGSPLGVEYRFEPQTINRTGRIVKTYFDPEADMWVETDITPPEVNIKSAKFYVNSPAPGGTVQPSIFILISGTAGPNAKESDFVLQTFVSQRILNIGID